MPSESETVTSDTLLEKIRETLPNQDILLIADRPPSPVPEWVATTLSSAETLAAPRPESRHTCGLILTPWVEENQLDAVIAHLRDFLSLELYVLHPGDLMEQTRRVGALGLRCLQIFEFDEQPWGLNHFSLKTYKKTPNWLNSRFWANPQLWNKFLW